MTCIVASWSYEEAILSVQRSSNQSINRMLVKRTGKRWCGDFYYFLHKKIKKRWLMKKLHWRFAEKSSAQCTTKKKTEREKVAKKGWLDGAVTSGYSIFCGSGPFHSLLIAEDDVVRPTFSVFSVRYPVQHHYVGKFPSLGHENTVIFSYTLD